MKYETKSTFVVGYLFPFQSSPSPYVLSTSLLNNESIVVYKHSFLALSGIRCRLHMVSEHCSAAGTCKCSIHFEEVHASFLFHDVQ